LHFDSLFLSALKPIGCQLTGHCGDLTGCLSASTDSQNLHGVNSFQKKLHAPTSKLERNFQRQTIPRCHFGA
jgi:hypothetical protein